MTATKILRQAALFKTPSEPWNVGAWTGNTDAFQVLASRLNTFEEWWDRSASIHARRMFMLLVAMEREEIDAANQSAYHGDIDGDFDY